MNRPGRKAGRPSQAGRRQAGTKLEDAGPRRMLFVSWAANLGGVTTSLHTRMKGLRSLGIHCEKVFSRPGAGLPGLSDFPVHVTGDAGEFTALVRSRGYEAISLINDAHFLGALRQLQYQGKVLYEVRGVGSVMVRSCSEITSRDVRAILVPSRYVAGLVRQSLVDRRIPVRVVADGVDTSLFRPLELPDPSLPGAVAGAGRPVVLWVGRLDPNKNWPEMLEVARLVVGAGHGLDFWVVADTNVSPDVEVFQQAVQAGGLDPRVRLIPCVPHRDMPYLYNTAARSGGCLLSTSKSEGLQNSLLEGMACGCPVVTSAVGGNVELVTDGHNGRLYPPGEPRAAAECIVRLVEDQSLRRKVIGSGLQVIRTRHNCHKHAVDFLAVLDEDQANDGARQRAPPQGTQAGASARNRL